IIFSSRRRRHTRSKRDWSSDVCSSDLTCSTFDGASHRFNVGTSHVGSFGLRDFLQLSAGNFTHFVFVRLTGTRLDTSRFFQQNRSEERRVGEESRSLCMTEDQKELTKD